MAKPPGMPLDVVEMLRLHKAKEGYSNAQVADALGIFGGWTWNEGHIQLLLAGKKKPTAEEVVYFKNYFLSFYVAYCRS